MMSKTEAQLVLPWDVLHHILRLADLPVLALLSRVSLDFLQAASSLLYRTVKLDSHLQMDRFFCETTQPDSSIEPSRITPYLSFTQIHHLSLHFGFVSSNIEALNLPVFPFVPASRLSIPHHASVLAIESLEIILHPATADRGHQLLKTQILNRLNPTIYTLTILHPPMPTNIPYPTIWRPMGDPRRVPYSLQFWDRLDKLVLLGSLPFAVTSFSPARHEVVLDLRSSEEQASPTPLHRMGSVQAPIGRAEIARRMLKLGWVGRGGRLRLLVGTEEDRVRLESEIGFFGEAVRGKVDVEVC
ncbi:hypothetical protein BDY24DRAFT_391411 [Mrakia frigida]|uniref:uncharacterized protein n=1 Tax=Mrakia frigida TaxID=29902 RepID=UPI003FCC24C8